MGKTKKPKQRDQYVYIGCEEKFYNIVQSHDSFILPDDGKSYYVFHQREYSREKKPKIIYALFQFFGSRTIKINPIDELFKYDRIFSIDTNYSKKAVTSAKTTSWNPERDEFVIQHLFTKSFKPKSKEPEKEAWRDFINQYNNDPSAKNSLIVDSDLGSIIKINRREIPIIEGFYIPKNWQLNYASSDVNDDFIMVKMMRYCEKANIKYMKKRGSR